MANLTSLYKLLNGAAAVLSTPATLVKRSGERVAINITPEETTEEQLSGVYPAAFTALVFSADVAELVTQNERETRPEEGDALELDGRTYRIIKDATTARTWDWAFGTPGERIKFYTMKDALK